MYWMRAQKSARHMPFKEQTTWCFLMPNQRLYKIEKREGQLKIMLKNCIVQNVKNENCVLHLKFSKLQNLLLRLQKVQNQLLSVWYPKNWTKVCDYFIWWKRYTLFYQKDEPWLRSGEVFPHCWKIIFAIPNLPLKRLRSFFPGVSESTFHWLIKVFNVSFRVSFSTSLIYI